MKNKSFQDAYPDELSYCYGCGRLNEQGLQLKSYWEGEETIAVCLPAFSTDTVKRDEV